MVISYRIRSRHLIESQTHCASCSPNDTKINVQRMKLSLVNRLVIGVLNPEVFHTVIVKITGTE